MKKFTIVGATVGALAAIALGSAGSAAADALAGTSAAGTIDSLKTEGYSVQLNENGTVDVPLSECTVTGVHGLPKTNLVGRPIPPASQFTTVYVDIDCPSND